MSNEKLAEFVRQWRERNAKAVKQANKEAREADAHRKRDAQGRFVAHNSKA